MRPSKTIPMRDRWESRGRDDALFRGRALWTVNRGHVRHRGTTVPVATLLQKSALLGAEKSAVLELLAELICIRSTEIRTVVGQPTAGKTEPIGRGTRRIHMNRLLPTRSRPVDDPRVRADRGRRPRVAGILVVLGVVALTGCHSQQLEAKPLHAPANFDPSLAGYVACSRLIVEGDVVTVRSADTGRMVTTLAVQDWVKPASGKSRARIETADIAKDGVYKRWSPGTHLRLAVDVDPSVLPSWQFSAAQFDKIRAAVPSAKKLSCPYGPVS
jgi:hypothetical protein